jgi:TRAP-type C4-dicarboxylate transport system permease small subunit
MAELYRKSMDLLYIACSLIAGISMVLISAVIPYSVYTRYVINQAASWPEPMAILLTIVLTFFGAAVCYRDSLHMRVRFFVGLMPEAVQRALDIVSELLVGAVALFMINYGWGLCSATWSSSIDAFPALSVGVTYLPIPIGAAISLLFVIERMTIGGPPPAVDPHAGNVPGELAVD